MHDLRAADRRGLDRRRWRGLIVLGLLAALAGCASSSSSVRPAPRGDAAARPAGSRNGAAPNGAPERAEVLDQAIGDVLLAREQARLGLIEEARTSWDRAIARLAPYAGQDPLLAERLAQIESERDQAVKDADLRARGEEEDVGLETETPETIVLESPEPPLDPTLLPDVNKAAQEITPDYPVVLNDRVYAWLEQWSRGLRGFYAGSLERSGRYVDRFRQIFAEEGLPQDLVYLAHVESGFKTSAYSRAAARGIFQFIPETGRRYGLVANYWLDERADPEKSCRASAAYLRDLYAEFGDWYLALAAYNAGEGKVRDVIGRTGRRDFFHPANQRLFRRETRNYVPAILAATLIAKNPAQFGFADVVPQPPLQFELATVPAPTSLTVLAEVAKTDVDTLRDLNPSLRRHSTPPAYKDFVLKVPVGSAEGFTERLVQIPVDQRLVQIEHVVRRGETLGGIARKYGVSSQALARANELGRRPKVRPGMVLVVPDAPWAASEDRAAASSGSGGRATTHRVRRGETLSSIAGRYGVTVSQLRSWNHLGSSNRIVAGQRLRIKAPRKTPDAGSTRVATAGNGSSESKASRATQGSPSQAAASGSTHVVRSGETLWRISQQYGVTVAELQAANGLGSSTTVKAGQRLKIPGGAASGSPDTGAAAAAVAGERTVHVVRRGETLSAIARRFNTSVEQLCRLNSLAPNAILMPGDTLTVR